jgi:ubiquinone/menaquinone biosynthesis C-methylase UbiE
MSARAPYAWTSRVYDEIYSFKPYEREARTIRGLIQTRGPSRARTLLDVACGTGSHLKYLSRWFECTGLDANPDMLRIARRKLQSVRFVRGRMERFRLARRFDAITCLFSAIAYVRDRASLESTFRCFAEHLAPGGVAIVEPFVRPSNYRPGRVHLGTYGTAELPIVRMNVADRDGDRAILEMHHLVGAPTGVRHWVERHDLALYSRSTYLAAFRRAGFDARFLRPGLQSERGLYVAVRRANRTDRTTR